MPQSAYWEGVITRLRQEGLVIDESKENGIGKARHYLPHIGMYRFNGYYEPFKPCIQAGHTVGLDDVLRLCKFDRRLRLLTLDALERIEVSIKGSIADYLFGSFGPGWFNNPKVSHVFRETSELSSIENYIKIRNGLVDAVKRRLKVENGDYPPTSLTKGAQTGHDLGAVGYGTPAARQAPTPIKKIRYQKCRNFLLWDIDPTMTIESGTFGDISRIIAELIPEEKAKIASRYRVQPGVLNDWLRGLTGVRNIAAHHCRLWNARFGQHPALPHALLKPFTHAAPTGPRKSDAQERFYVYCVITFYLLNLIARHTKWHERLRDLLLDPTLLPSHIDVPTEMGFPPNWHKDPYWKLVECPAD